jgi:hypothetical protein
MVSLFMGLFTAAGIMKPRQKSPAPKRADNVPSLRASKAKRFVPARPAIASITPLSAAKAVHAVGHSNSLPPAISGLLATLPIESGIWTKDRRDQFLNTFGVVLDYSFQIGEPQEPEQENGG